GRVLAVTAVAPDLARARERAYKRAASITFEGRQMRRDIGWRALARTTGGYAASGVDIDAGNETVARMKAAVERTHNASVLGGVGSFGGTLDVSKLKELDAPVLVASTDGVGTKVLMAAEHGRHRTSGMDIVNHCINDVLVQRAEPLFFLDYIAASKLVPAEVAEVVGGMAEACEAAGCVLLGGETAEMPGVYTEGHFDVAGTLVGVVDRARLLPRTDVAVGDVLIGLRSSGPHTNGYSLLRRVFAGLPLESQPAPLDRPLVDALLEPHRSYLEVLRPLLATDLLKALVHITGGGLPENLPRALPNGVSAKVQLGSWPVPPLFRLVRDVSGLDAHELHRTLNMGVGMVLIVSAADVEATQALIAEESWVIGELIPGDRQVTLAT
ncbi:MAG: purD, partial [Acidimicrobiia bacterium]|nr:purD [Acidimicrobiia bacterium]